jgi:hypothetical protein
MEKLKKKFLKNEKGSITVYVLASMLFMLITTSTIYMNVSNKTNEQEKQLDKIVEEYKSDQPGQPDYKKLEDVYNEEINKKDLGPRIEVDPDKTNGEVQKIDNLIITISLPGDDGLAAGNKYQYYLLEEGNSFVDEGWKSYSTETSPATQYKAILQNVGEGFKDGTYYLYIRQISDTAGRKSFGGTIQDGYHKFGPYQFNSGSPTIAISPEGGDFLDRISTKITATGNLGKDIKSVYYQITSSNENISEEDSNWESITNSSKMEKTLAEGTYYLHVKAVDEAGVISIKTSKAFNVVEGLKTAVTNQSLIKNYVENSTEFSVTTNATTNLTYQWYYYTDDATENQVLIGSGESINFVPTTPGTYHIWCYVQQTCRDDAVGYDVSRTIPSDEKTIEIVAKPTISISGGTQNYVENSTAFTATVSGTKDSATYQWYYNTSNVAGSGTAVGTNSTSYAFSTSTAGTYYISCKATFTYGGTTTVTSATKAITIVAKPTISISGGTQNYVGNSTEFNATVSGTKDSATYQWYYNTSNVEGSGTAVGTNITSYKFSTNTAGIYYISLKATFTYGGTTTVTSATTKITIAATPTISISPTSATVVVGNDGVKVAANISGTNNSVTFQWYYKLSTASSYTKGGTTQSGPFNPTGVGTYYVYCTAVCTFGGTKTITSSAITVVVQTANYSTVKSGKTTYYNTINSAVSGATSGGGDTGGGTITVLNSLTDSSTVSTNKTIAINTNGKTLTRAASITTTAGTLTVKGTGSINFSGAYRIYSTGGSVATSGTPKIQSGGNVIGFSSDSSGTLNLQGGYIYSTAKVPISISKSGTVNISDTYVYTPACTHAIQLGENSGTAQIGGASRVGASFNKEISDGSYYRSSYIKVNCKINNNWFY